MEKAYLGDGAYVEFDGFGLSLTTEDGIRTTNRVYLEPEVFRALTAYMGRVRGSLDASQAAEFCRRFGIAHTEDDRGED